MDDDGAEVGGFFAEDAGGVGVDGVGKGGFGFGLVHGGVGGRVGEVKVGAGGSYQVSERG